MKRRDPPASGEDNPRKRVKLANASAADVAPSSMPKPPKPAQKIFKLTAPRPFPAVAASASTTGPRSARKEGNNYICLTRKSSLGAYLRRCKDLVAVDGYKTLHLHAMGAAIPLLMELSCTLPPILPYPRDDIHTSISTGTVEVQDEVHPDDEDQDITFQTRAKSTLYVIIRIGDGVSDKESQANQIGKEPQRSKSRPGKDRKKPTALVFEEPEQDHEAI